MLCLVASVAMQWFFLAVFAFMLLEAMQLYAVLTNLTLHGGYFMDRQFFALGWGGTGVVTLMAAVIAHPHYVSQWS